MLLKIRKSIVDICKIKGIQCIKRLSSDDSGLTYDIQAVLDEGEVILIDVVDYDQLDAALDNILQTINDRIDECTMVVN